MDVIIIGAGIGGLTLAWLCITTGNTMAPCVIIGERDAELVRESHRI